MFYARGGKWYHIAYVFETESGETERGRKLIGGMWQRPTIGSAFRVVYLSENPAQNLPANEVDWPWPFLLFILSFGVICYSVIEIIRLLVWSSVSV